MKVLVVVDMQHDFLDGVLGTKEAKDTVAPVRRKVDGYMRRGDVVIYTQDTHQSDYLSTQEGRLLPVIHCVKGTPGWKIVPEVWTEGARVVEKSAFGSLQLVEAVKGYSPVESIELVGVCTDICVISNAILLKTAFPEVPVYVDPSCCAGVTPESHLRALDAMKMCQIFIEPSNGELKQQE